MAEHNDIWTLKANVSYGVRNLLIQTWARPLLSILGQCQEWQERCGRHGQHDGEANRKQNFDPPEIVARIDVPYRPKDP
ncbi:hypothetical protein N7463_007237 [Penicillium fimorum]|uniref:Uncharacterized protein n=1 Tax=Penicillium fimorum TaxID=1882269 RepID=A0A9X0C6T9_9EURO|nr:hypothetical protein N7463_007237 [Penicillium fimorum]